MDLKCKHCDIEKTYAGANIADIKGETCPENTITKTIDGQNSTRELKHEWVEI